MPGYDFDKLKTELIRETETAENSDDTEKLRVKYLGRKGILADASKSIGSIKNPDEKRKFGSRFGEFKRFSMQTIEDLFAKFERKAQEKSVDLTLPGRESYTGGLHPLTAILDEVIDIFRGMGFTVETGPEVESVYYNFDALNTPFWHPARDLTDTFYIAETGLEYLLRTETSPVQIRVMERKKPPIRIIAPGRVYRSDKPDATHSPVFMQVEGLYVDEGVTFADLKGTVMAFYRALFGKDTRTRFRPHFFPFTEPSAEVDVSCIFCGGKGCRVCKQSGWLEMGGSGMVDPNVLEGVNIDPEVYSGWAFGLGIERIAMLKYQVDDIRLFYENDIRFLKQFN